MFVLAFRLIFASLQIKATNGLFALHCRKAMKRVPISSHFALDAITRELGTGVLMRSGKIEQNSRLLISFGLLAIAAFLSVQNFETARIEWMYTTDMSADMPNDLYYVFICIMGWVLLLIGNTLRYWAWSLTIYSSWWLYSEITVYLQGGFHGYGSSGCSDCNETMIKLYAPLGLFAVVGGCLAILRTVRLGTKLNAGRLISGATFLVVWFYSLLAFGM